MADEVNDECRSKIIVQALIREEVSHIEQIARVLSVQRSDKFSSVEIGERNQCRLSVAKGKHYIPEQIIGMLREAEAGLVQGEWVAPEIPRSPNIEGKHDGVLRWGADKKRALPHRL